MQLAKPAVTAACRCSSARSQPSSLALWRQWQQHLRRDVTLRAFTSSCGSSRADEPGSLRGHATPFSVFNSLGRSRTPLTTAKPGLLTWYACGPTVYDSAHIGHARTYVCFDIVRRILQHNGIDVIQVMGVTDVDDKIVARALERKMDPLVLARNFEEEFWREMQSLNVLPPTIRMRVTDNIGGIIDFVRQLVEKRLAYSASDGVYFDVAAFESQGAQYRKLVPLQSSSQPQIDDQEKGLFDEGSTRDKDSAKKDGRDFALWKCFPKSHFGWESPWGFGRPGWHIECSVMSTGGIDLKFPHHDNEIAQCEAYHDTHSWCRQFLHTGHVKISGQKMSKSLKNFTTIKTMLDTVKGDEFRLLCLLSRYRYSFEYAENGVTEAKATYRRIKEFLETLRDRLEPSPTQCGSSRAFTEEEWALYRKVVDYQQTVKAALCDDFDTASAVSSLMELIRFVHKMLNEASAESQLSAKLPLSPPFQLLAITIASHLGMFGLDSLKLIADSVVKREFSEKSSEGVSVEKVLDAFVGFRHQLRVSSVAAIKSSGASSAGLDPKMVLNLCDEARNNALANLGIVITDSPSQSSWKVR